MRYDMKSIMKNAWKMFRKGVATFSECLKIAWRNAKVLVLILASQSEECHTWYGWKEKGFEVIHESVAKFKVEIVDPTTRKGTRILSYFGKSQVQELAE